MIAILVNQKISFQIEIAKEGPSVLLLAQLSVPEGLLAPWFENLEELKGLGS